MATVLIVDDVKVNAILLATLLKRQGHDTILARDGQEALDRVMAGGIELVLMDLQMPVMDGFEATRQIRAWEAASGQSPCPVVAVTASADEASACAEAGMNGCLVKPLTPAALGRVLAKMLGPGFDGAESVPVVPAAPTVSTAPTKLSAPGSGDRVFDPEAALATVNQDRDVFRRLVSSSLPVVEEGLQALADFNSDSNSESPELDGADVATREAVRRAAHRLIGVCGILAARPAQLACRALEQALLAGSDAGAEMSQCAETLAVLRDALITHVSREDSP